MLHDCIKVTLVPKKGHYYKIVLCVRLQQRSFENTDTVHIVIMDIMLALA
jgi:hypothetical protein